MVRDTGEVSLCYVLPEFFRRGVGQSLMKSLERHLARIGRARVMIYTTLTGQGFYRHLGYRENGQALRVASVPLRPMHKSLSACEPEQAMAVSHSALPSSMQVVVPVA
jgi:predicted N-acetyltransferase YhbS